MWAALQAPAALLRSASGLVGRAAACLGSEHRLCGRRGTRRGGRCGSGTRWCRRGTRRSARKGGVVPSRLDGFVQAVGRQGYRAGRFAAPAANAGQRLSHAPATMSMQSTGHAGTHSSQPVQCLSMTACRYFEAPAIASTGTRLETQRAADAPRRIDGCEEFDRLRRDRRLRPRARAGRAIVRRFPDRPAGRGRGARPRPRLPRTGGNPDSRTARTGSGAAPRPRRPPARRRCPRPSPPSIRRASHSAVAMKAPMPPRTSAAVMRRFPGSRRTRAT